MARKNKNKRNRYKSIYQLGGLQGVPADTTMSPIQRGKQSGLLSNPQNVMQHFQAANARKRAEEQHALQQANQMKLREQDLLNRRDTMATPVQQPGPQMFKGGGMPNWLYRARGRAMRNKMQAGGMYADNTAQSAGQGVLGTTANIVYQESDPRVLAERRKELDIQAQKQEEAGQEMVSRAEEMQTIGEATEKEQALLASQASQQKFATGEAVVGQGAQLIQAAQAAKAAQALKVAQAAVEAGTATAAQTTLAAGGGAGAGAAGAVGPGLILSGLGYGVSALASDEDPTTYTGGEVTGEVLKGAGTGASIGAMVGGPAAPVTGLIGGLIGGIYGGVKGLVSRNKARKAEKKAKEEWQAKRNKAIKKHNEKVRNVMLTHRSASRQAELEAKTYSGYDIGRNVAYQRGGMFMGVPRYGYAA